MEIYIDRYTYFPFAVVPIYAASSTFLPKAQKWIDNNCSKRFISNQDSLLCFIFEKSMELDQRINGTESRLSNLESLPNKELKMFDSNGNELGLYIDVNIFYYPHLQRFVNFNLETGGLNTAGVVYFGGLNCSGDAYKSLGNSEVMTNGRYVFNAGDIRYFVLDYTTPSSSTNTNSYLINGVCTNESNNFSQRKLREVTLSIPNPIPLPVHASYE